MADPIITDVYRCQARFQGATDLPEDVYINNWAFRNDEIGVSPAAAIKAVLDAFYFGPSPANASLTMFQRYGSSFVVGGEYRVYDLGQPPPRAPEILPMSGPFTGGGTPLPEEVAVCLSYVATVNQPRSRGRLYMGPLALSALTPVLGRYKTADVYRSDLAIKAAQVMNTTQNVGWVLVSPTDVAAKVITGGWVDDAPDTQRRRGSPPQARQNWGGLA